LYTKTHDAHLLGLTALEERSIMMAALLAYEGRHDEAEATRWAANYHGISDTEDAR
jgi:hypothetical protein